MSKRRTKRAAAKQPLPGYEDEADGGYGYGFGGDQDDEEVPNRTKKTVLDELDQPSRQVHALSNVDSDEDDVAPRNSSEYLKQREQERLEKIERQSKSWGKNRENYYSSETAEYYGEASDDERAEEEESEVQRLQRLQAEELESADFGLDDIVTAISSTKTKGKKGAKTKAKDATAAAATAVDDDEETIEMLTDEEKIKRIIEDSPELLTLLDEFNAKMKELKSEIAPLVQKARRLDPSLATSDGISFLQLKHQLLLRYCIHVAFYLLLKAEGKSVANHPVIKRLVAMRLMLERLRPIEKHLKYQIEKLLKAGAVGDRPSEDDIEVSNLPKGMTKADVAKQLDLLSFKPNLASLTQGAMDDEDLLDLDKPLKKSAKKGEKTSKKGKKAAEDEEEEEGDGETDNLNFEDEEYDDEDSAVVRQRLMGAAMFDASERKPSKAERQAAKLRSKASTSRMVQEFYEELSDRPEVASATGRDTQQAFTKEERERLAYEEANYVRLMDDKKSRKRRANERVGAYSEFDDFADMGALAELEHRQKMEEEKNREILGQIRKRTKLEAAADGYYGSDDDAGMDSDMSDIEDDFNEGHSLYREFEKKQKKKQISRAEERKARKAAKPYAAPKDDSVEEGTKRFAGKTIVQNRGLTRTRNQESNPRTRYRAKHEKALQKRRSAVKEFTSKPDEYTGQATGIKRGVIRSIPINH